MQRSIYKFLVLLLVGSSCTALKKEKKVTLFSRENLVAWCIVPFDSVERTPHERADMLNELGIHQLAYDWREKHLPSFAEEIQMLKEHDINLKAVWMWIDPDSASGKILDDNNEQILKIMQETNTRSDLWLGFSNRYFEGLTDEQKLEKAATAVLYLNERAEQIGCSISLYNHGDWFGEPMNQIKIIQKLSSSDVGIVYNFHHAHEQIEDFGELLKQMLPYLNTVNINGMKAEGPKILTVGQGDRELEMLSALRQSGYNGSIGIIGHIEEADAKAVLQQNIQGLKTLLEKMGDTEALTTY